MRASYRACSCLAVILMAGLATDACHRRADRTGHAGGHFADHRTFKVADRLDCPPREGDLALVSAAPDGRSCQYRGGDDEQAALSLLALNGAAPSVGLAPIEADLRSQRPHFADAQPAASRETATGAGGDHAKIDLPGLHINADNDHASVRVFGVNIDADNSQAHVRTRLGGYADTSIDAHPGGAVIRAGSVAENADLVYVLASDSPGPNGYRAVGYVARGPASGPLVVAVFKSRSGNQVERRDLGRLINRNLTR